MTYKAKGTMILVIFTVMGIFGLIDLPEVTHEMKAAIVAMASATIFLTAPSLRNQMAVLAGQVGGAFLAFISAFNWLVSAGEERGIPLVVFALAVIIFILMSVGFILTYVELTRRIEKEQ